MVTGAQQPSPQGAAPRMGPAGVAQEKSRAMKKSQEEKSHEVPQPRDHRHSGCSTISEGVSVSGVEIRGEQDAPPPCPPGIAGARTPMSNLHQGPPAAQKPGLGSLFAARYHAHGDQCNPKSLVKHLPVQRGPQALSFPAHSPHVTPCFHGLHPTIAALPMTRRWYCWPHPCISWGWRATAVPHVNPILPSPACCSDRICP